jgi:cupin fold WbuC family metalloprotein
VPSLSIKRLNQELFDNIAQQARSSPRLRQNYNLHELSEKVQRFINVLQLGTYVRPHRHCRITGVNGFEFFLVCQGELGIIVMDESGQIIDKELVSAHGVVRGIELSEGTYHTLVALAPDTVILELKEGPYDPSTDKEFLDNFPPEGTAAAKKLVETWQGYFK